MLFRALVIPLLIASGLAAQVVTPSGTNATALQGLAIKPGLACLDTYVVTWVAANSQFECSPSGGGGSGTVTSVATTGPLTGGTITTAGTIACPTCGVTGSPLSQFSATTSAQLAGVISNETGTGVLVFATSPALVTPDLGTPSAAVLTLATGLPISTGVSGLATGIATFLGTPSSANLATAVTDETGSGALVFAASPTLSGTVAIGTSVSIDGTTGIAASSKLANVALNTITAPLMLTAGVPSAVTAANIYGLFSGCSGTLALLANGACGSSGTGVGTAPYTTTTITASPMTITAVTHGQGTVAVPVCWDTSTPRVELACSFTRASNGDLVLTYTSPTPGEVDVFGSTGGFANPLTTRGDLIYRNSTTTTRLAIGGANTILSSDGTDASWATATGTGSPVRATSPTLTTPTVTTSTTLSNNGIGAVSSDGYVLQNTTAAAVGAQQWSPRLHFIGQGWKTTATAASQQVEWLVEAVPVQNTTNPNSGLYFTSVVAGSNKAVFGLCGGTTAATGAIVAGLDGQAPGCDSNGINTGGSNGFGGVNGSSRYGAYANGTDRVMFSPSGMTLSSAGFLYWTSGALGNTATGDLGITRGAAGQLNINDGSATVTNYRDIVARTHIGGGSAPTVDATSCTGATIGTGSTNTAGTITGLPTSTCSVILTFSGTTATTGWSCGVSDKTTGNLFRQSASTTTTATFAGTSVSGDVLAYGPCAAY